MLRLTKKADYGLIALKHLTVNRERTSVSAKEIADAYGLPLPLLSKILQQLTKNGFLNSEQGTNGGYRLARDPRNITALEVIRTIDGPIILTECFTEHGHCDQSHKCTVRAPLRKVHEGILRLLAGITISDMSADEERDLEPKEAQPMEPLDPAQLFPVLTAAQRTLAPNLTTRKFAL